MKLRTMVMASVLAMTASLTHAEVLSLYTAWQKAQINEPAWKAAQADATIDREEENKALSGLLPSISYSGSQSRNTLTQSSAAGSSTAAYPATSSTLSLRQPLFRMQTYSEYRRSATRREGSEFRLSLEEQSLIIRVAQAYFDVLQAEDVARSTRYQEKSLTTQLDAAKKTFKSGNSTRVDIDEAKARLAMATADRIAAGNGVTNAKKRLSAIVGMPVTEVMPIDNERVNRLKLEPARFEEWLEIARQGSPELAAARKSVEEAGWALTTARAGHLPTLDLLVAKGRSSSDFATGGGVGSTSDSGSVGVQLNVPLFAGNYTQSDTAQAVAKQQKAIAQKEGVEALLETRLLQEYTGFVYGREHLESLAVALESSKEALVSTKRGVTAGTRTSLDVLNAERQLYNALLDEAKARYELVMSRMRLMLIAGKLQEPEIKEISGLLSLSACCKYDDAYWERFEQTHKADSESIRIGDADKTVLRRYGESLKNYKIVPPETVRSETAQEKPAVPTPAPAKAKRGAGSAAKPLAPATRSAAVTPPAPMAAQPMQTAEAPPAKPAEPSAAPPAVTRTAAEAPLQSATALAPPSRSVPAAEPAPVAEPVPAAEKTIPVVQAKKIYLEPNRVGATVAATAPVAQPEPVVPAPEPIVPAEAKLPPPRQAVDETVAKPQPLPRSPRLQAPQGSGTHVVILGAFGNAENVAKLIEAVEKQGIPAYSEPYGAGLMRVRAGPFDTKRTAAQALSKLKEAGIAGVLARR